MNKTCTVYRYWGVYVIIGVASKMSTPTKPGLGVRSGPVFPCVGKIPGTKGCMLLGSDSCIATSKNSCTRDIYIIYVVPWNVRILPLIQQSLQVNSDIYCISSRDWWILDNLSDMLCHLQRKNPLNCICKNCKENSSVIEM